MSARPVVGPRHVALLRLVPRALTLLRLALGPLALVLAAADAPRPAFAAILLSSDTPPVDVKSFLHRGR